MIEATPTDDHQHADTTAAPATPAGRVLAWVDQRRQWIFFAIVLLYLAGFTGKWRVAPDSGLYMSLGRSLAEGHGFVYHGETHTRFEPGLPLVIAASHRLFGPDRYMPVLALILACSLASVWLTYRLMLRHAGRPTAVLVTASFAVCETCLRYGFQIVTDTPFLVALLVYLLGYERLVGRPVVRPGLPDRTRWLGWPMLVVATLLMVTFRPATMTFVGAVGLATAWNIFRTKGWPLQLRHALIGLVTLGCFLGFRAVDPRRQHAGASVAREARLKELLTTQRDFALHRIATETVPDFVEEILPEAVFGMELGTGVDTAASLLVMGIGVALFRRHPLWGAWIAATFFQCMFWLPRERYLLPVLPMLLYALWRAAAWATAHPRLSPGIARVALALIAVLYLGPNLVRDLAFIVEQRRVGIRSPADAGDRAFAPYLQLAREIEARVGERDVVFASDHYELSYFSRRRVEASPWSFRWPPTAAQQREFFKSLRDTPALYAVLPDTTREAHVAQLVEKLGMRPGQAVTSVERPPDDDDDDHDKPQPPLTLYRLERAEPTTVPATAR